MLPSKDFLDSYKPFYKLCLLLDDIRNLLDIQKGVAILGMLALFHVRRSCLPFMLHLCVDCHVHRTKPLTFYKEDKEAVTCVANEKNIEGSSGI